MKPKDFVPTGMVSLDSLVSGLEAPQSTEAPPVTPVAPVVPPVQTPPVEEEKPGDISKFVPSTAPPEGELQEQGEPPAPNKKPESSAMRKQLEKLAEEKRLAEEQREKFRVEAEAYTSERDAAREEYRKLKEEHEKTIAQSTVGDPYTHPEVRELTEPWNGKLRHMAVQMEEAGMESKGFDGWVGGMIQKYINAGQPGTEDFRNNVFSLRDEIDDYIAKIPRDGDRAAVSQSIMGMVREGATIGRQVAEKVNQIRENAPLFQYKQEQAVYSAHERDYSQIESALFNPTEDVKIGDPLNQSVILRGMIDGSEEVRKVSIQAKQFAKMVLLPPPPINLEGIDPERRQEAIMAHHNRYNEAHKRNRTIYAEALVARAVLPALWKELETLRGQVAAERGGPRPRLNTPDAPKQEEAPKDIREFTPITPDMTKIPL